MESASLSELDIHSFFDTYSASFRIDGALFAMMASVERTPGIEGRRLRAMLGEYLLLERHEGALRLKDFGLLSRARIWLHLVAAALRRRRCVPANLFHGFLSWGGVRPILYSVADEHPITVIIPVYNGYDSLRRLCSTLFEHTSSQHRILFVNDASPDERIALYLDEMALAHANVSVLTNGTNLGFPGTVNRGVAVCDGDFVLLNTDTEVPDGWIPRLFAPIWNDSRVASVMPLTCDWANSGKWNPGIVAMSDMEKIGVNVIDSTLQEVNELKGGWLTKTNLGFCLAVSREAWNRVGPFAAEIFGRGYHEEADWCARARYGLGYKHCIAGNVFVAHWHNGSFTSEQKKAQIRRNHHRLKSRNPQYVFDRDPLCVKSLGRLRATARSALSAYGI